MTSIAIVGYGDLADRVHRPALTGLGPECRLSGVVDPDRGRRQHAAAAIPGATVTRDLAELLSAEKVDAVVIATPPRTHAEVAEEAFAHGLAVYLEKPLATDREDGMRIIEAWKKAGTVGMIGFNYRLNPQVEQLRQKLREGRLGSPVAVRTSFGLSTGSLPDWKRRRTTGGGALLDLGSHHIDLIRFLFDEEIRSVSARIRSLRTEDDHAQLDLELGSGLTAQTMVWFGSATEDRIVVYCQAGKWVYDRYSAERLARTGREASEIRRQLLLNRIASFLPGVDFGEKLRAPWREPSFPRALRSFCEAVGGRRSRRPDLEDGWRSLAVVLAAEQSHREGRRIEVSP